MIKTVEKDLEYIFVEAYAEINEFYRRFNVDPVSSELTSYVLGVVFSFSLKAYVEASKLSDNDSTDNLAFFDLFSRIFKDEFLDHILKL